MRSRDAEYTVFGRAFPDPHGCVKGAPATSPWAKGNACAIQFAQWQETLDGLAFLEGRFGRYMQVLNLCTQFGDLPEFAGLDFQSAGLPQVDLSRDRGTCTSSR